MIPAFDFLGEALVRSWAMSDVSQQWPPGGMPTLAWAGSRGKDDTFTWGLEMGDDSRSGHNTSWMHCMVIPRVNAEDLGARTMNAFDGSNNAASSR